MRQKLMGVFTMSKPNLMLGKSKPNLILNITVNYNDNEEERIVNPIDFITEPERKIHYMIRNYIRKVIREFIHINAEDFTTVSYYEYAVKFPEEGCLNTKVVQHYLIHGYDDCLANISLYNTLTEENITFIQNILKPNKLSRKII